MNKKALVFAVAAACLTSGAAFAQSYGYGNDSNVRNERSGRHDRDGRYDRNDRNDRQYGNSDYNRRDGYSRNDGYNRNDGDRYSRRDYRDDRRTVYAAPQYYQHRRGGYVSQQYRDRRYVVSDWRGRRLHQPQHGYHWVQAGNDYLLVAIATGLIAQVLLNH